MDDPSLSAIMESTRSLIEAGSVVEAARSFSTLSNLATCFRQQATATFRIGYLKGYYPSSTLLNMWSHLGSDGLAIQGCQLLYEWNDEERDGLEGVAQPTATFSQLPLAFFLHQFVTERRGARQTKLVASLWKRLMTPAIVAIVTSAPLTIRANLRSEVLYAAGDEYKHDPSRRNAFCWRQPEFEYDRNKDKWTLMPVDGRNDRFYIVSKTYGSYLYATDFGKRTVRSGESLSRVFLWEYAALPDLSGVWILVPLHKQAHGRESNDVVDVFALYNPHMEKFLFSTDHCKDDERRYVFVERHVPNTFPWMNERKWGLAPALAKTPVVREAATDEAPMP